MCARNGQKKYNKLCPREKDTEIRRERKNDFRGLDVGEGVYEGKMKNRKKINWALIILIYFLGLLTNYFLR